MSQPMTIKQKYTILSRLMDERTRRLWAASEALALGWGGVSAIARETGLSYKTITAGVREIRQIATLQTPLPPSQTDSAKLLRVQQRDRIRRLGGGRKLTEVTDPAIEATLDELLANEVAGDPMSEKKWVRSSPRRLSRLLKAEDHEASSGTVRRLLKKMGYSLKANERKQGQSKPNCPERDEQFRYIAAQKALYSEAGLPIISVDSKKKELIGNFRKDGKTWCKNAEEVNEHDFPGIAECRAVPFGVYDLNRNRGHVYVGISN
jgi:hypothetical protein